MGSHRVYRARRYAFGQQLLTLRTRVALTQIALAEQIGVHRRSIQNWERAMRATLRGHSARKRAVAWSPNHALLASGSLDQTVKIWDIAALHLRAGQPSVDYDRTYGFGRWRIGS
jgi:WD40 repeat protein